MRIDLRTVYDPATVDRTQTSAAKKGDRSNQTSPDADFANAQFQVSGLEAKVANVPDIRQSRVDQLRQAIQAGTYTVANDQLAQAIMNNVLKR